MRELPSPLWSYSPVSSLIWPTFYERAPLSSLVTQSSELSDLTHVVLTESSLHLPGYRLWWVLWSDLSCSEIVPLCSLDTQFSELSNLTYVVLRKFPSPPWTHRLVSSLIWPTLFWGSCLMEGRYFMSWGGGTQICFNGLWNSFPKCGAEVYRQHRQHLHTKNVFP